MIFDWVFWNEGTDQYTEASIFDAFADMGFVTLPLYWSREELF